MNNIVYIERFLHQMRYLIEMSKYFFYSYYDLRGTE